LRLAIEYDLEFILEEVMDGAMPSSLSQSGFRAFQINRSGRNHDAFVLVQSLTLGPFLAARSLSRSTLVSASAE
jgi:hypothetical protein